MIEKIEKLLIYAEADKKVDAVEKKVKSSDERKNATVNKARYEKAVEKRKELIAARDKAEQEMNSFSTELDKLTSLASVDRTANVPEDAESIKKLLADIEKILGSLAKLQDKINKITKQVEDWEKDIKNYAVVATKAKDEFNQNKEAYENILKEVKPEIDKLKAERESKAVDVDNELLEKYLNLRKNKLFPLAVLKDKRCSGCGMEMPGITVSKVTKDGYCECENCGRILYAE